MKSNFGVTLFLFGLVGLLAAGKIEVPGLFKPRREFPTWGNP
jgi:hypothetical protein